MFGFFGFQFGSGPAFGYDFILNTCVLIRRPFFLFFFYSSFFFLTACPQKNEPKNNYPSNLYTHTHVCISTSVPVVCVAEAKKQRKKKKGTQNMPRLLPPEVPLPQQCASSASTYSALFSTTAAAATITVTTNVQQTVENWRSSVVVSPMTNQTSLLHCMATA